MVRLLRLLVVTILAATLSLSNPAPALTTPNTPAAAQTSAGTQMRGAWISTVFNLDWPSASGLDQETQRTEFIGLLDEAVARKLTAVFVQIRPSADSFWPGALEPWSQSLTGQAGGDPGYDPLAFMVAETHARGLEFHAWFNPYRIASHGDINQLPESHPARQHPDWVVNFDGKLSYNPGHPDARRFVVDAITDPIGKYDIDGVHLDDYFYPYPVAGQEFDDRAAYEQFGSQWYSLEDWRRVSVNSLIQELHDRIKQKDPNVQFGVSPFAVWRNAGTDSSGSQTSAGIQTYDDLYADTREWVRQGWLDYIAPQVYWAMDFAPAPYANVVNWWAETVRGTNVKLYIGEAAHRVGTSSQSPGWQTTEELTNHLTYTATIPEVSGHIFFRISSLRADQLGAITRLVADHY